MSECYTREYWLTNPGYHLEDSEFKAESVAAALEEIELHSSLRICDVGCGAGGVLHSLTRLLGESGRAVEAAVGYDISPPAIAKARELFPDVQFEVGSVADIAPGWDIILAMDVIEHLEDYYSFLRDLRGKSRFYVFHVPMELNAFRAVRQQEFMEAWDNSAHIHHFCETTVIRAFETTGFATLRKRWTDVDQQQCRTTLKRPGWKRRIVNMVRTVLFRVAPGFAVALLGGKSLLLILRDGEGAAVGDQPKGSLKGE